MKIKTKLIAIATGTIYFVAFLLFVYVNDEDRKKSQYPIQQVLLSDLSVKRCKGYIHKIKAFYAKDVLPSLKNNDNNIIKAALNFNEGMKEKILMCNIFFSKNKDKNLQEYFHELGYKLELIDVYLSAANDAGRTCNCENVINCVTQLTDFVDKDNLDKDMLNK